MAPSKKGLSLCMVFCVWVSKQHQRIYRDQSGIVSQEMDWIPEMAIKLNAFISDGVMPMLVVIKPYRYRSFGVFLYVFYDGSKVTKSKCYGIYWWHRQFKRRFEDKFLCSCFYLWNGLETVYNFLTSIRQA